MSSLTGFLANQGSAGSVADLVADDPWFHNAPTLAGPDIAGAGGYTMGTVQAGTDPAGNSDWNVVYPNPSPYTPAPWSRFFASCWFKLDAYTIPPGWSFGFCGNSTWLIGANYGEDLGTGNTFLLQVLVNSDPSQTKINTINFANLPDLAAGFHNLMISLDNVAQTCQAAIDGVLLTQSSATWQFSGAVTPANVQFAAGASPVTFGTPVDGTWMGDLFIDFPAVAPVLNAATFAKFMSGGLPVSLGPGGAAPFGATPVLFYSASVAAGVPQTVLNCPEPIPALCLPICEFNPCR